MNQSENSTPASVPAPNPKALLPILLFLIVYLGNGIFFEYIKPAEGQMGFYVVSVVLAFSIALIAAFMQNKKLSFDEKIHICAQGIGDDNIVIMLFIFLMAGAFSGIASEAGGASSTANLLLNIIPGKFAVPGLFVIACLISMAMGTSVGTISVLEPLLYFGYYDRCHEDAGRGNEGQISYKYKSGSSCGADHTGHSCDLRVYERGSFHRNF